MWRRAQILLSLGRMGGMGYGSCMVVLAFVGYDKHRGIVQAPLDVLPCRATPHAAALVVSSASGLKVVKPQSVVFSFEDQSSYKFEKQKTKEDTYINQ